MTLSDILAKIPRVQFRVIALALFAVLILHILATLAAPRLAPSTAYSRLADLLPVNSMQILPPIAPGAQPLPFMGPDSRYAMCRFDSTKGPVQITAILPGAGWSLSLFTDKGDSLYTSVAQPGRRTEISLVLVTSDEKFAGLTPRASGRSVGGQVAVVAAKRGVAHFAGPDRGFLKALDEAD